jgi:5'-nucleotidase/UDP-sugar diphosphatase
MIGMLNQGSLYTFSARANPDGASGSSLYLLQSTTLDEPVQSIITAPGVSLPERSDDLLKDPFLLRIIHFNDLHGHFLRFPPGGEESVISHHAWYIKDARQKIGDSPNKAALVLSSGDDCGGSIFDEMLAGNMVKQPVNPSYQLYSKIGVDAACIGNHDLDRGLHLLTETISQHARFPILASNLRVCQDLQRFTHAAAILVTKGLRIGMIGLVTRAENHLDPEICQLINPITAAENILPALRPHCDVIIILSHLGFSLENKSVPMQDAGDVELARALPPGSVDLIVGGHSHDALNKVGFEPENIVNGIPIVQAGASGHFLGQVDLIIDQDKSSVQEASLIPIMDTPVEKDFEVLNLSPLSHWAKTLMGQEIGKIEDDSSLSTESVLKGFSSDEGTLANFVTDALVASLDKLDLPVDLAMIDSSSLQGGLALADMLTFGDCFQLMPYSDRVRIYELTGDQLIDLLNDNAFRIQLPGETPGVSGFLQFSKQLRYEILVGSSPIDRSSQRISFNNDPIEKFSGKIFRVAATSFTRELAFHWEMGWSEQHDQKLVDLSDFTHHDTDLILRDEIIRYIQAKGGLTHRSGAIKDGRLVVVYPKKEN